MASFRRMYYKADRQRLINLPTKEKYRSDFRRDSARLLHCPSFRRLQGKMQLFPGQELDFFRNRLTHSLEVGQIGKSIAIRLNETEGFLRNKTRKIDPDLVELAGWCHDLGHPPFGHTGEEALDECMRDAGGFEGNAQTLRILAKLEKRQHAAGPDSETGFDASGEDRRAGLNLTFRTLASILKYDQEIPVTRNRRQGLRKGYYVEERGLVALIREAATGEECFSGDFRTVECDIMDLADDIAYSTYDLEDAFKAGFLTPIDLVAARPEVVAAVADQVTKARGQPFSKSDVRETLEDIFGELFTGVNGLSPQNASIVAFVTSRYLAENGYQRMPFTSGLVTEALRSVEFQPNERYPSLSRVRLSNEAHQRVEVLKHFTFQSLILSPDLRVISYRGRELVKRLFEILTDSKRGGEELLPHDVRQQYNSASNSMLRKRIICDFIAGMTDSYSVEYYGRLTSETPQTLFKSLS